MRNNASMLTKIENLMRKPRIQDKWKTNI